MEISGMLNFIRPSVYVFQIVFSDLARF